MKIFIEVGANTGSDTQKYINEGYEVYAFEPVPDLIKTLTSKFKDRDNFNLIPMAVDLTNGFKWFNVANDVGCSSLYNFTEDIYKLWQGRNGHFEYNDKFKAMTIRLDTFMDSYNIESVDYLWIDAQGNDFNVLKSLGDKLSCIKEGKCEGSYSVDLYQNTNNNSVDIANWLQARGFSCDIKPDAVGKEADIHFTRI